MNYSPQFKESFFGQYAGLNISREAKLIKRIGNCKRALARVEKIINNESTPDSSWQDFKMKPEHYSKDISNV